MKNVFLIFIMLCGLSSLCSAQYTISDWYGNWKGDLHIIRGQDTLMIVPMGLEIEPQEQSDTIRWVISYLPTDRPADIRSYVIFPTDSSGVRFILDEKNGITMPVDMHANALYSLFDVGDIRIMSRIEQMDDHLNYCIESSNIKNTIVSPADSTAGIPEVTAWALSNRHRAVLIKQ